jgi:hypothetical protein
MRLLYVNKGDNIELFSEKIKYFYVGQGWKSHLPTAGLRLCRGTYEKYFPSSLIQSVGGNLASGFKF